MQASDDDDFISDGAITKPVPKRQEVRTTNVVAHDSVHQWCLRQELLKQRDAAKKRLPTTGDCSANQWNAVAISCSAGSVYVTR